jgi:hypothetical protein
MPSKLYSLNDGNQDKLLVSLKVSQDWVDSVKSKYDWNEFDLYDNRLWEYMYKLFDETMDKSGIHDDDELWNKLNRQQKVFWAFLSFNGDTDNGGVHQFVINRPKFIVATTETWKELGIEKLETDYNSVLAELTGKTSEITELKSSAKIENYYYDKEFKKKVYKKVADYIENNIEKLASIEK